MLSTCTHFVEVLDVIHLLRQRETVKISCKSISIVGVEVSKEIVDQRVNVVDFMHHTEQYLYTEKTNIQYTTQIISNCLIWWSLKMNSWQ